MCVVVVEKYYKRSLSCLRERYSIFHIGGSGGIRNTPKKLNFGVIIGKKKENKGAEVGVKPESTEVESKGAEGGLKVKSTSHGSDESQEHSTERLVSSLAEALKRGLGS